MKFKCIEEPRGFFADGEFTVGETYDARDLYLPSATHAPDALFNDDSGLWLTEHLFFFEPADDEAEEALGLAGYRREDWRDNWWITGLPG